MLFIKTCGGNSLAVQWLELHASTVRPGLKPWPGNWDPVSYMAHSTPAPQKLDMQVSVSVNNYQNTAACLTPNSVTSDRNHLSFMSMQVSGQSMSFYMSVCTEVIHFVTWRILTCLCLVTLSKCIFYQIYIL